MFPLFTKWGFLSRPSFGRSSWYMDCEETGSGWIEPLSWKHFVLISSGPLISLTGPGQGYCLPFVNALPGCTRNKGDLSTATALSVTGPGQCGNRQKSTLTLFKRKKEGKLIFASHLLFVSYLNIYNVNVVPSFIKMVSPMSVSCPQKWIDWSVIIYYLLSLLQSHSPWGWKTKLRLLCTCSAAVPPRAECRSCYLQKQHATSGPSTFLLKMWFSMA